MDEGNEGRNECLPQHISVWNNPRRLDFSKSPQDSLTLAWSSFAWFDWNQIHNNLKKRAPNIKDVSPDRQVFTHKHIFPQHNEFKLLCQTRSSHVWPVGGSVTSHEPPTRILLRNLNNACSGLLCCTLPYRCWSVWTFCHTRWYNPAGPCTPGSV